LEVKARCVSEEHFPDLAPLKGTPAEVFRGNQFLLTWPERSFWLTVDLPEFNIAPEATLFGAAGKKHAIYPDFATFQDRMLERSADFLWPLKPMQERVGPLIAAGLAGEPMPEQPPWPDAHTLDVASDEVYIRTPEETLHHVKAVTISGRLFWERSDFLYCAMEKVPTGEMFASAMVATNPIPGRMWAIIVPTKGRTLDIRSVQLPREQINILKNLELTRPKQHSPAFSGWVKEV
jgi:hypothetical protein